MCINPLRDHPAALRARSLLAYLDDMSRRSLARALPDGLLATIYSQALSGRGSGGD
ncbi:MAG: hypothetical protein H7836_07780 [Magnetococcus sp. YQC-3]